MGRTVRIFLCGLSAAIPFAANAETADQYIAARVKPHFAAYKECAKQHLGQAAKKDPTLTFERVESSLRPACGVEIEAARDALFRGDFSRSEANAVIKSAYAAMQPELRALFEQAGSFERERRQTEKSRPVQPPPEAGTGLDAQEQLKAVERERAKFLKEASEAYDNCLISETKSLAPSSNEPADTLKNVIEIKCAEPEKRLVGLGIAFYGASKEDFRKIVGEPLDERKKRLVADIVTLRADLAKETAKQPKETPEAGAGVKPTGGN